MAARPGRAVAAGALLPDSLSLSKRPTLSVVVPVLNEAAGLDEFLSKLMQRLPENTEVVVVDGGSEDGSWDIAQSHPVKLIQCSAGRARQMNEGAALVESEYLMFLHADTELPESFADDFVWWVSAQPVWGFSSLHLTGAQWWCRLVEFGINMRTRITSGASGDQAQIVKTSYFRSLGGFADIALMEDIALSYRLRRRWPARRFPNSVLTSSRRWRQGGVVKTVLLMWFLRSSYRLGVSPQRLAHWYRGA